jgi:hypothetical protein
VAERIVSMKNPNDTFRNQSRDLPVCGPTKTDDGYWRIETNQEIKDILKGQNIIGFIKKQKLNWLGHVEHMTEGNIVLKVKRWKPMSKRPFGRPKMQWEDDFWKT